MDKLQPHIDKTPTQSPAAVTVAKTMHMTRTISSSSSSPHTMVLKIGSNKKIKERRYPCLVCSEAGPLGFTVQLMGPL